MWDKAGVIEIVDIGEMNCCKQAWDEWLTSSNPYAEEDIKMMEAENGQYFNFVRIQNWFHLFQFPIKHHSECI